jgi:hypothetical protein
VTAFHKGTARPGTRRTAVVRAFLAVVLLTGAAFVVVDSVSPDRPHSVAPRRSAPSADFRAFSADSWWNTPLPRDAPLSPRGDEILRYLRTAPEARGGCVRLAGAEESPWGQPIYWAKRSDPSYRVQGLKLARLPELRSLRIPQGASPAPSNDSAMTVYDVAKGYVVLLTNAQYDPTQDSWSASAATVTYLDSNGLHARLDESDEHRNRGSHRGNNGAVMAVTWDEIQDGAIRHVLKVASGPEVANRHVFPMVGSDGDYQGPDPAVPPQGLRMRIKPSVDLRDFDLHPTALIIARALQRYGVYIGDSAGVTTLKLEATATEGRGQLWDVTARELCDLPLSPAFWDVIRPGYGARR